MRSRATRALRRRRRVDGHRDEEHAPQHERLPRRGALQLRLPQRREDERRHLVPARRRPPRRDASSPTRSSSASTSPGGKARGVRGRFLDGVTGEPRRSVRGPRQGRGRRVRLDAHAASSSAKSGLDSVHIGRHLTLHPGRAHRRALRRGGRRLGRRAAERLLRSLLERGHLARTASTPPSTCSPPRSPGVGREHRAPRRRSIPNLAFFGGMVHDDGGGQVRRWLSREPLVTYKMIRRDKERLLKTHPDPRQDGLRRRRPRGAPPDLRHGDDQEAEGARLPQPRAQPRREPHRVHGVPPARLREDEHDARDRRREAHRRDVGRRQPLRDRRQHPADEHRRELAAADHGRLDDARARARRRLRRARSEGAG